MANPSYPNNGCASWRPSKNGFSALIAIPQGLFKSLSFPSPATA
jgi:hypothetical protein